MQETFITRKDMDVGVGEYDSIAWAFEVHVKKPDRVDINSALLCGSEDAPTQIIFFASAEPTIDEEPVFVWDESD